MVFPQLKSLIKSEIEIRIKIKELVIMKTLNQEYRQNQFKSFSLNGKYPIKIKLRDGDTNKETFWLNISQDEFNKIKEILER